MTDDFDLDGGDSPFERNISSVKTYVVKERLSYAEAIAEAQGKKTQLFAGGLRKPRFEDILFVGWRKIFDAFWYMDGSYDCDFLRQQKYNVNVPVDVVSMKVGENVYSAQGVDGSTSIVSMDVVEKCNIRNLRTMCLNATTGFEDPTSIPLITEERVSVESIQGYITGGREEPHDVFVQSLEVADNEAISRFEGVLVTRPREAERILNEQMGIEHCLTYIARFVVIFINQKDGAERELSVHGITGDITW